MFPDRLPDEDEIEHCRRMQRYIRDEYAPTHPGSEEGCRLGISDWMAEELIIEKERNMQADDYVQKAVRTESPINEALLYPDPL